MGSTTELRRAVKARFFPFAEGRGFVADLRLQPLTTTFRRRRNGRVEMFDLHGDKYGPPRFVLHFGTCPDAGLRVNGEVVSPEDRTVTGPLQPLRGS